jgi:hypothetical protein
MDVLKRIEAVCADLQYGKPIEDPLHALQEIQQKLTWPLRDEFVDHCTLKPEEIRLLERIRCLALPSLASIPDLRGYVECSACEEFSQEAEGAGMCARCFDNYEPPEPDMNAPSAAERLELAHRDRAKLRGGF